MTVSRRFAFSLIEVVLALGIVSFALVAILGLLSVGLDSSRESIDDTAVTLLGQDAYNRVCTDIAKRYNQSSSSSWPECFRPGEHSHLLSCLRECRAREPTARGSSIGDKQSKVPR